MDLQTAIIENEHATPAEYPKYAGPIFDADTHLYETQDAFSRYLPQQYAKDWGYHYEIEDGHRVLYVGPRKVETSAGYYSADGKVPAPGKLHEWLKAMKAG